MTARDYQRLGVSFVIAIACTLIDAVLSYYSIAVAKIAVEANPVLLSINDTFTSAGAEDPFLLTMVVRTMVGIWLIFFLVIAVLRAKNQTRITRWAMPTVAGVLLLTTIYHFIGITLL